MTTRLQPDTRPALPYEDFLRAKVAQAPSRGFYYFSATNLVGQSPIFNVEAFATIELPAWSTASSFGKNVTPYASISQLRATLLGYERTGRLDNTGEFGRLRWGKIGANNRKHLHNGFFCAETPTPYSWGFQSNHPKANCVTEAQQGMRRDSIPRDLGDGHHQASASTSDVTLGIEKTSGPGNFNSSSHGRSVSADVVNEGQIHEVEAE